MKTIRTNTFETNSSSTHSLTIQKKSAKKSGTLPLVIDGVLHPENLSNYTNHFGDSSILSCDTPDMKAAILMNWVFSVYEDEYDDVVDEEEEGYLEKDVWLEKVVELVKEKMKYNDVFIEWTTATWREDPTEKYLESDFSPYEEYCDDPVGDWTDLANISKFIDDVVLNNEMEIIDSDTPT